MRYLLKLLLLALVVQTFPACGYFVSTKADPLPPREKAPAFELTNQEGETVALAANEKSAQPTVIEFYRGEFCYLAEGRLEDLQEERERISDSGARLVAIGADDPETVSKMSDNLGLTYDVLADPEASVIDAYGVTMDEPYEGRDIAVPATFVVAPDGTIVYAHVGGRADDFADVDDVLAAIDDARSQRMARSE